MPEKDHKIKIILSGGGTGGSVTPLLALKSIISSYESGSSDFEFLWIGTKTGPERHLVESSGIEFRAICSGKLRRYLSILNLVDIFKIKLAFWQSFFLILEAKPDLIVSAGSFVSVPLVWAAWLLRVPVLIQQLDVRPGLSNKLMAPFARKIMVTFKKSLADYGAKAVLVGNPVRKEFIDVRVSKREAMQKIGFLSDKPVLLVIGGGTGSVAINEIILDDLDDFTKYFQIMHVLGKGKSLDRAEAARKSNSDYRFFEFLDTFGIIKAYAAADIIISRAGMASLTELCFVAKPSVIIPIPESHQEENASVFQKAEAAIILNQTGLTGGLLLENIVNILRNNELQKKLRNNIKGVININCEELIRRVVSEIINLK